MDLNNEFQSIRDWAEEKGIYESGDLKTQTLKLVEEVGELSKAVINDDVLEIEDAIGDAAVVLTSIAHLASIKYGKIITIESCVNGAYGVIAKRTGKMENGSFVKDK